MKFLSKRAVLVSSLLISPFTVFITYAQVLPPATVPFDGGITVVISLCAAYGAKKLMDKDKHAK